MIAKIQHSKIYEWVVFPPEIITNNNKNSTALSFILPFGGCLELADNQG